MSQQAVSRRLVIVLAVIAVTSMPLAAHHGSAAFETGKKVSDAVMNALNVLCHAICPQWSYTILPQT